MGTATALTLILIAEIVLSAVLIAFLRRRLASRKDLISRLDSLESRSDVHQVALMSVGVLPLCWEDLCDGHTDASSDVIYIDQLPEAVD